ncbi:MAG: DUF4268 domain-containing protein [Patescibacteria group bacterium]|nr:DUF4268 domain-containing protein [Patescibacteria group bacterium]
MNMNLGTINEVDLRGVWAKEPEFTRWLAEETHLDALGEELGLDLTLIKTEANVGDFSVDILAEEAGTSTKVIIENQLEMTNHDHLGKLITYASGHEASYVIWIFREMREEHRKAIDWLNEHTTEDLNFFGIKLELWRIGDSTPAPKFDVLCRPNGWAKTLKRQSNQEDLSEGKQKKLVFWQSLNEYSQAHTKEVRLQNGLPQHWSNVAVGSSDAHISLWMDTRKHMLGIQLYVPHNKNLYKQLCDDREKIEKELGKLEYYDTSGKAAYVAQYFNDFDIDSQGGYEEYFAWLLERTIAFNKVFRPLLRAYKDEA